MATYKYNYSSGEKPSGSLFGSSYLNREWEIVSVQEMCRRLSLDQLDKVVLPLPDGAASSEILDESMIRQVCLELSFVKETVI